MIEYIIQSPENITSYEIQTLLPLFIIIPLIINRKRVNVAFNNFARAQMAKQQIQEFDKDGDEKLSKEEYQGSISIMMEDLEGDERQRLEDIDSDALFDKYDSNKDGKLDGDEISSMLLEVFDYFRTEEPLQEIIIGQ